MNPFNELTEKVKEGILNPLIVYKDLKEQQHQLEEALKEIQPLAIEERLKDPEKVVKIGNALIELRSTPSQWDFSGVKEIAICQGRLEYLKNIAKAGGGMDASGNEIERAYKIEGKQSIAIKFIES